MTRAPSKQQTSLKSGSGRQMGASVPLRRESPPTTTHRLFLVGLAVMQGADWAVLPSSTPCHEYFLFHLQRNEAVLGKGSSSCWSLSLPASILLCYWTPSLPWVLVREFQAVWPWAVVTGTLSVLKLCSQALLCPGVSPLAINSATVDVSYKKQNTILSPTGWITMYLHHTFSWPLRCFSSSLSFMMGIVRRNGLGHS